MNKFFSTQDGLCMAVTDETNQEKLLLFKYHKEAGKLEVSTMKGETIESRFVLAPEDTCKVIADFLNSVAAYDKGMHPEHIKAKEAKEDKDKIPS